ncbi:MAG: hypothetical protein ACP5GE_06810, partial [Thermoplasmata archaeon]
MMLNLIYCNPMEFIEENLDYDIFILPDSISIRNLEIHMLRRSGHEYFPVEKFHTIDSLALSMLGKNNRIIPRFMERYMTSESLKDLSFYRELHNNENFITLLLDEYNEIKDNIIADNIPLKKGEFFTRFDERFSRFLERLGNGVNIDGKIWHFYSRADMTMILSREFSKISGKRIVFAGFYYISPTLKELLENARMKNDVFFISEPLDDQSSFILEKRLSPDLVSEKNDISFISEIYELPDMRREVRFIANFILERMDEENLKFSDFVVAFPEAKKYQWYVEEIFNEYSIPYFIETRIKFREMDYFNSFLERLDYIESEDIEKDLASIVQDLLIKYKEDYESIMKMWQAIQEFFFEIEALSIDYSKDLLISYLSTVSYGRFYGDYNTVSVVDIGNAHFRRGRYIIIGGMNEELFPRPLRGNIIFKDEYQGIYKRDFKTHEANEKYRLYSAILNFDRVIFTLPYFNSQGKRLLHSYLIDYLMENGYTSPVMKRIGSSEIIFSREKVYSKRDAFILENNEVIEEADPYNICTNELKKIIGNMEITPTHITTYNRCPRKFLFMHVLGIRYPEEPLSPANQGNYA